MRTQLTNYRGISLINCITKLFTSFLKSRLTRWADTFNILPECQAGFRKYRSCQDQIFSLNAMIHNHIRKPKGKLYAVFIDYKRAFDSIDHKLLWNKLYNLGVSAKIINIIRSLYNNANFIVRAIDGHTSPIDVTEGVLQGDSLSPLLFSLFIADMNDFFVNEGMKGLSINEKVAIIMMMFADDTIILARNKGDLQDKLDVLKKYCDINKLIVNVSKTKVMVFSKSPHVKSSCNVYYNEEKVEVVKEYVYLEVPFHSSGFFCKSTKYFINRANNSINSIWSILCNSRCSSFDARVKLFESLTMSTLLYSSSIWGLRYEKELETVQSKFFKRLLSVPKYTPNYLIRLETGRCNIICTVI